MKILAQLLLGKQIIAGQPITIHKIKICDWSKNVHKEYRKKFKLLEGGYSNFQNADEQGTAMPILITFLYFLWIKNYVC